MINFKEKKFGVSDIINSTVKGAGIGGSIGGIAGGFGVHLPFFKPKWNTTSETKVTTTKTTIENDGVKKTIETKAITKDPSAKSLGDIARENPKLTTMFGGMIIGGALGFLFGIGKELSNRINQKSTVNARLLADVVKELTRLGYKEGIDFTRDPKTSTDMKMKVCLVVSKVSGAQQVIVNTVSDPKLQKILDEVIKSLPKNVSSVSNMSDRFNDITLAAIPDKTTPKMIAGIAERFIKAHYPVYMIEVG